MHRILTVLILSLCAHLLVLAIRFTDGGVNEPGEKHPVHLSADHISKYVPEQTVVDTGVPRGSVNERQPETTQTRTRQVSARVRSGHTPASETDRKETGPETVPARREETPSRLVAQEPAEPKVVPIEQRVDAANGAANMAALSPRSSEMIPLSRPSAPEAGPLQPVVTLATPRYAENPKPAYPDVARRRGWSGEVQLRVQVSEAGRVAGVELERSSGYAVLDRAARRAVRRWRFIPARVANEPVASEVVVPIDFRLPDTATR